MAKTIVHEFPLTVTVDGKGFRIVDDFTRPNPLDHTRFDHKDCSILVVSGWTGGNFSAVTFINPTRVDAEKISDEKEVVRIITRHNEQVFRMLNAAIALLRTVSLPRAHKATINIKEQTLGTSLFLYDWIITPVCNCYNATITIESDFGISGIEISSYEFSDREPVSVHTISDSKLSRQLEEAAEKSLKEKILIAA